MKDTELIIEDTETNIELPTEEAPITDFLLWDEDLAEWLNEIATWAMKTVTSKEEGSWQVPDYTSRLKALDMQFRMKWHFKEKAWWNELPKWIYIFKKT